MLKVYGAKLLGERNMSNLDSSGPEFGWPWTFRLPGAPGGSPTISFAPERLWQPINPGWTFGNVTINSTNSSAPDVEQAVVNHYSYGKQIGRMMDALQVLVKTLPAAIRNDAAIKDFVKLAAEVDKVKDIAAKVRLERLRSELNALKTTDRKAWEQLVKP
jgi:hypothetical protein